MVNSEDFTKRLQEIMDYYDMTAAAFADSIEVGRSSISHLLSGRNKPSLDFVLKIVYSFPEVELYWLLNGKGSFPNNTSNLHQQSNTTIEKNPTLTEGLNAQSSVDKLVNENSYSKSLRKVDSSKVISKIVIFYSDGSFEAYKN